MSFLSMALRYLRFRWLVTLLTVAGIALGVALVCAVLALRHEHLTLLLPKSIHHAHLYTHHGCTCQQRTLQS